MKSTDKNTPATYRVQQIPFMVRFIFIVLILSYIINLLTGQWIENKLTLNPESMFSKYQAWRMLIFWVYEPSMLTLSIMLINCLEFLVKFQRKNSSIVLLNDLFINLAFIAFVFVCCEFVFSFMLGYYPNYTFTIVYMWMNMLYKYAYFNSEQRVNVCFIKKNMKIIYYPFVMLGIVFAVNWSIRLDALLAVLLGMVQCRYFKGGLILFVKESYDDKQKAADWLGVTKFSSWQTYDQSQIKLNERWTVSSSQFYIDLANYQGETMIAEDETADSANNHVFSTNGVQIGGGDCIQIMK